ncbi:SigE family RNA polymerase sigma factor [Streptomyces sp. NPDC049881]|uniref:SigE family RNA polymerase sigma factor n=1 Tax=Streptomyces sp. NPDC049881 TaxID=3155778 RepID=UPI00344A16E2
MRRRDDDRFYEFAVGNSGRLYRAACLLTTGDTHLAEDLVQEALGRMYTVWHRRKSIDNPSAYAQTVLARCYLGHARRRSSTEEPIVELPDRAVDATDSPLRVTLLRALAALSPKDRTVLVLRFWEDRSIEQTAEAMRTSSSAVRTRTSRALARLRVELGTSDLAELAAL